jgi:hypothetical protein|tara:strand:+ start:53 stop:700 length:648 start_codon:yes stop_codon:yes gene_type:complete
MRNIITFLILIMFSTNLIAQNAEFVLTSKIKKRIEKNILVGRIFENIKKDDFYSGKTDEFILDNNWELDLKYNLADSINFPNKEYVFYRILNNNYNLINRKTGQSSTKIYYDTNSGILENEFLIGINKKDSHYIYFISGILMKSQISHEFKLDLKKPETFFNFLKIKLNNYKLSDLKFHNKRKGKLIFESYSNKLNKKIRIKIDRKEFDKIEIIK